MCEITRVKGTKSGMNMVDITVSQPIANGFVQVKTDGTVENFFESLQHLTWNSNGDETTTISSRQYSVWTLLAAEKIWHNGYAGYLFIPLPISLLRLDQSAGTLRFTFNCDQKDDANHDLAMMCRLQPAKVTVEPSAPRWKVSSVIRTPVDQKAGVLHLDLTTLCQEKTTKIAQIVFYFVGLKHTALLETELTHKSQTVRQYETAFEALVVDKSLHQSAVPNKPIFTVTFCDCWRAALQGEQPTLLVHSKSEQFGLKCSYDTKLEEPPKSSFVECWIVSSNA